MAYYFYLVHHLSVLWYAKFQCALFKHNMVSFVPCQWLPKYLSTTFSASEWKEQSEVYILRLNHVSHDISIYASCKYERLPKEKWHASFNWHHYIWRAVVVHDMRFNFLTRYKQQGWCYIAHTCAGNGLPANCVLHKNFHQEVNSGVFPVSSTPKGSPTDKYQISVSATVLDRPPT